MDVKIYCSLDFTFCLCKTQTAGEEDEFALLVWDLSKEATPKIKKSVTGT